MQENFSPKSPTLEEHLEKKPLPEYINQGEIGRIFENIFDEYKEDFARRIMEITGGKKWAIDLLNQELANKNASQKVASLENKRIEKRHDAIIKAVYNRPPANDDNYEKSKNL